MTGKLTKKDNFKSDTYDVKYGKTKKLIPKPLFEVCGQGGIAQFSSSNDPPVNVGSVTVDGRSLSKPLVKIKFSSVVNLTGLAADPEALLTFRLLRVCDGGVPFPLNSWVYEAFRINEIDILLRFNTSFAFIFCDRFNYSKLCDYLVEVSVDNLVNATVVVNNVQIQALVQ